MDLKNSKNILRTALSYSIKNQRNNQLIQIVILIKH